jgi:hypothetical protein
VNVLGLEVQDIDDNTVVTDVTLLIQGLTPDGERAIFLRSTVTDKVTPPRRRHGPPHPARGRSQRVIRGGVRSPRTVRELHARIREHGYEIEQGKRHLKVKTKDGGTAATMSATASDHRAVLNMWSTFRRAAGITA